MSNKVLYILWVLSKEWPEYQLGGIFLSEEERDNAKVWYSNKYAGMTFLNDKAMSGELLY